MITPKSYPTKMRNLRHYPSLEWIRKHSHSHCPIHSDDEWGSILDEFLKLVHYQLFGRERRVNRHMSYRSD